MWTSSKNQKKIPKAGEEGPGVGELKVNVCGARGRRKDLRRQKRNEDCTAKGYCDEHFSVV